MTIFDLTNLDSAPPDPQHRGVNQAPHFGTGQDDALGLNTPNTRAWTNGPPFVPTTKIDGSSALSFQSIAAMPQYEALSAEELRIADYGWDPDCCQHR